jgi:hypothetical protein
MKKQVTELNAGDVIDPPAGEKKWLWKDGVKRRYTVVSVELGKLTKKGRFMKIKATVPSPYRDEEPTTIDCEMLESKSVTVHETAETVAATDEPVTEESKEIELAFAGANAFYSLVQRKLIGGSQLRVTGDLIRKGEQRDFFRQRMVDLQKVAQSTPAIYEQDGKGDDALVYLHYFSGGSDWYVLELEPRSDEAFGWTCLNGDLEMAELGYISIGELTANGVELDFHWETKRLGDVRKAPNRDAVKCELVEVFENCA